MGAWRKPSPEHMGVNSEKQSPDNLWYRGTRNSKGKEETQLG